MQRHYLLTQFATATTLLCALAFAPLAHAEKKGDAPEDDPAEAVLAAKGITSPETCLDLSSPKRMIARKKLWSDAIHALAKDHPDRLHEWIVGAAPPPALVMQEAIKQRDCMFAAIVQDAADPDSDLLLDYGDEYSRTKRTMAKVAATFTKKSHVRDKIAARLSQSHYRDAAGQAFIWYRKYAFTHPRSFNLISPDAATKCGLTAGHSWKPQNKRHKRCWKDHLTREERQREILTASSAPGISRHHWGTEFDLYGLNPRRFVPDHDLYDEYAWMKTHAMTHGFFQPFLGPDTLGEHTYIEERWHWSYYPIAQALIAYIEDHPDTYEAALDTLWEGFDVRWRGKKSTYSHFSYVKLHWKDYVLHTARLKLAQLPLWMSPSSLLRIAIG